MNKFYLRVKLAFSVCRKGMTLIEVCIATALMGTLTLGIMSSMNMMSKMQVTLNSTISFNEIVSYINQSIGTEKGCNILLQAENAPNQPAAVFNLSSTSTDIMIYNTVTSETTAPSVYIQPGKQFGPLYIQSVKLLYNPASAQSVSNSASALDSSSSHYKSTDKIYRGVIQISVLKAASSLLTQYNGFGGQVLTNYSSSDLQSADSGIPISLRLDTGMNLVSCTGLRAGNLTPYNLPTNCPAGYSIVSDGTAISCKLTNCPLGQVAQGTDSSTGGVNCVNASCSSGMVSVYVDSSNSYECKRIVCPTVSGVPTLPVSYDSDGYITACGSINGTYGIACTAGNWTTCSTSVAVSTRNYTCTKPTSGPLASYPDSIFYCTENCATKVDQQPCYLHRYGPHTSQQCTSTGGSLVQYSDNYYYCVYNNQDCPSGWTALGRNYTNPSNNGLCGPTTFTNTGFSSSNDCNGLLSGPFFTLNGTSYEVLCDGTQGISCNRTTVQLPYGWVAGPGAPSQLTENWIQSANCDKTCDGVEDLGVCVGVGYNYNETESGVTSTSVLTNSWCY